MALLQWASRRYPTTLKPAPKRPTWTSHSRFSCPRRFPSQTSIHKIGRRAARCMMRLAVTSQREVDTYVWCCSSGRQVSPPLQPAPTCTKYTRCPAPPRNRCTSATCTAPPSLCRRGLVTPTSFSSTPGCVPYAYESNTARLVSIDVLCVPACVNTCVADGG